MSAPKRRRRSGMALAASLAAITAISVLITGIWVITDLNAKTSVNRRSALNALLVAEAGLSHGLALMRGDLRHKSLTRLLKGSDDDATATEDNGLLVGYGLTEDNLILAAPAGRSFGGGTYTFILEDDVALTENDGNLNADVNNRLLARCRGVMPDGASAEIIAIIGVMPLPAMATEGNLDIGGNPTIQGQCGGLHANQIIDVAGNSVRVQGSVTASETVNAAVCQIKNLDGTCHAPPLNNQPPIDIPVLTMDQFCGSPAFPKFTVNEDNTVNNAFTLKDDGTIIEHTPGGDFTRAAGFGGWTYTAQGKGKWSNNNAQPPNGVVCSYKDVEVSGSPGSVATPWKVSIYTNQSVKITGSPILQAVDPDGGLIIAQGDVSIAGTTGAGFNYSGMIYAGSQCELSGNAKISGQVLCKDQPHPTGSNDYVNTTSTTGSVSGSPEITFNCSGSVLSKRKILSWVQKLGT